MITSIAMGVAGEVGASDRGGGFRKRQKGQQFNDPLFFLEHGSKIRTLKLSNYVDHRFAMLFLRRDFPFMVSVFSLGLFFPQPPGCSVYVLRMTSGLMFSLC